MILTRPVCMTVTTVRVTVTSVRMTPVKVVQGHSESSNKDNNQQNINVEILERVTKDTNVRLKKTARLETMSMIFPSSSNSSGFRIRSIASFTKAGLRIKGLILLTVNF